MIDEILDTYSLGDRLQIEYVLQATEEGTHSVSSLKEACYTRSYGFRESFNALVKLLEALELLSIQDGLVRRANDPSMDLQDNFVKSFCERLFLTMAECGEFHCLFNNETISADTRNQVIYFRNSRAYLRYAPIRNLLLSIGFMSRDARLQNVFVVIDDHYDWFLTGLLDWTSSSEIMQGSSLAHLKENLERQEQAGHLGEKYVIGYEKRRLANHVSVNKIRRISDENVGAGYDIISFLDESSAIYDRFIEVKSFSGAPSFFLVFK